MESASHHELEYPHGAPPGAGSARTIAPGVRWLRLPLPFALDHINLWLLEDGEGWCLVDTGVGLPEMRALWEQAFVEALGGRPLTRIVVTHCHPDHIGAAAWLAARFGCEVWMSATEFHAAHAIWHGLPGWDGDAIDALFAAHGLDAERRDTLRRRGNAYRRLVDGLPRSYRRLLAGDRLAIGGREWQVLTAYGHAPEQVLLFEPGARLLIAGDQVLPKITANVGVWASAPDGDPLARYLASNRGLGSLPADTLVLPAHGEPYAGLHARLAAIAAHHEERLDVLLDACGQGLSAAGALPVLFRRELDPHQTFFAMSEAIAHLNHLWRRGAVARRCDEGDIYRFSRGA